MNMNTTTRAAKVEWNIEKAHLKTHPNFSFAVIALGKNIINHVMFSFVEDGLLPLFQRQSNQLLFLICHEHKIIFQTSVLELFEFILLRSTSADNINQSTFTHLTGEQICSCLFNIQQLLQIFVGHFTVLG